MKLFLKSPSAGSAEGMGRSDRATIALDQLIGDPSIISETERLLAGRTRDIRLRGRIAQGFRDRIWRQTASVIRSWMVWVALLTVFMLFLNMVLLPHETAMAMFLPGALIIPAALGVALVWRKRRSERVLCSTLYLGTLAILLCLCGVGVAAGGELVERYIDIMLFVAVTAVIIFSVPFLQTLAIAASALALYLVFHLLVMETDLNAAMLGFFFFASGVGATVVARRTMTILAQKSFLLELRDRQHMSALAETNRRLERLSRTDGLTGTANRHWMRERMEALWAQDGHVAILMCDIDHFKALNDHLGHLAGDRCLVEVARIITNCTRSDADCVARYGGEEFMVVLPGVSEEEALAVAERIREEVAEASLPNPRSRVRPTVTLSIGAAVGSTHDGGPTAEQLQMRADAALYFAKRGGRNQVRIWHESMDNSGAGCREVA